MRRLLIEPRREHSRKPDEAALRIERLLEGPYLELFARRTRAGWDTWGAQAELFDRGPVATRRRPSQDPERRRKGPAKDRQPDLLEPE